MAKYEIYKGNLISDDLFIDTISKLKDEELRLHHHWSKQ